MVEEIKTHKELLDILSDNGRYTSQILLKSIGKSLLFMFGGLVLGVSFFLMASGIVHFLIWFFFFSPPAYAIGIRVLNINHAPLKLPKIPIPWVMYPVLLGNFFVALFLFLSGFKNLISEGFLDQNLIYMLFN
jgi:hypothetical protein